MLTAEDLYMRQRTSDFLKFTLVSSGWYVSTVAALTTMLHKLLGPPGSRPGGGPHCAP